MYNESQLHTIINSRTFRDAFKQDILNFVDKIRGNYIIKRIPPPVDYQPTLLSETKIFITSIQTTHVPADDLTDSPQS